MPLSAVVASQSVLVITAAVLFYVGLTDLKHYTIRNEVVLVLAALFFLHAVLSGRWTMLHWNLAFAALLFAIMFYFYSLRLMGGGDLKLLTVAFLWVGPFCALQFSVLLLVFIGIYVVAVRFDLVDAKIIEGRRLIAFAPSIAAALIGVFMIGCLQPVI